MGSNEQDHKENEEASTKKENSQEETVTIPRSEYEYYKQTAAEAENLTKRIKADFDNYKKSIEREKEQFKEYSRAEFIENLLPVLDTFEQAINNTKSEEEKKGIGLIYSQLLDRLEKEGLKPIETKDQKFDPYKHEILMQEESDKEDDTILEEFQKGYMFKDRVLRYSKVKVAKKRGENEKESEECGDQ